MVKTYFSLAGIATLGGLVWFGASTGGCSSDDATAPTGDAGNGTSSGSTNEGGTQTPTDSGASSSGDSGNTSSSGGNPTTPIKYGQCGTFTKCGGDVLGSWKVTGGCLSEDQFADAKAKCPGLVESNVDIKGDGTIVIDAANVTRNTIVKVTADVTIPKACATIAPDCATVASGLQLGFGGLKFDKATCAEKGTNCECAVESSVKEETVDTYNTDDGVLTTDGPPKRTYEYCVTADMTKTTYKETTADAKTLKLIVEITKQ